MYRQGYQTFQDNNQAKVGAINEALEREKMISRIELANNKAA